MKVSEDSLPRIDVYPRLRYGSLVAELARRQDEIVKQLDLTRNQASSQMDSSETQTETQQTSDATNSLRRANMRRATIRV